MAETTKFKAQIAKSNVRSTKITVIGSIIVALIGFLGMIYVNSKTDDNKENHEQLVQELMKQLNTLVIPQIQRELEEINVTLKELAQNEASARERIARIEGIIEALPKRVRPRSKDIPKIKEDKKHIHMKKPVKLFKLDETKIQQVLRD